MFQDGLKMTVSEFVDVANQTLEYSFSGVIVEGEVSQFKVSKDKFVFFDLKDEFSCVGCFMMKHQLHLPLENGMRISIKASVKLTQWGKFSLTVISILPLGDGAIKKSFDVLKIKLATEGLFDPIHKRPLPFPFAKVGVISSIQAAGYADFMKILDERWGGLEIQVADVVVQGVECPEQVVRALTNFNKSGRVDVIAIVRGGGSIQDLAAFNDEALVRAVASSKIPIISGIGHEIDETLVDLAADMRASTPSNAAQILTPISKHYYVKDTYDNVLKIGRKYLEKISETSITIQQSADTAAEKLIDHIDIINSNVRNSQKLLEQVNPENVLRRGYGLIRGELTTGSTVNITTHNNIAELEVKNVHKR